MSSKIVSAFLVCFIFGVAIGSLYTVSLAWMLTIGLTMLVIGAVIALFIRAAGLMAVCIVLGVGFGIWYVNRSFGPNEYVQYLGQRIEAEGMIIEDPINQDQGQQLTLLPDGHSQYIRAQLFTAIPGAQKGDRVWIRGQLEMPENFSDFDYIGYLQRWGVYAVLKKPRVIILRRAVYSWRTPLLELRQYILQKTKVFPQSEGSLIVGMLIGQRQNIPEEVSQAFKTTGLTHIVAVSGFNMTVIATACGALVWYIGRRATNILTLAIVFGFVVITGATAAVVRAAIMAVLMVCAQLLGRQYASLYSLLVVAGLMVLHNPRVVIWDVGFQLSVAATFGVLIAFRIKPPEADPNRKARMISSFLAETLRPTLGAIALTAPIIAYHFSTFSVIAPVANLLVLPFVSWIMLFGALSMLPWIGGVFVYPAQALASIVLFLTAKLSQIPYASIELSLPLWALAAYYAFVFWYIHRRLRSLPYSEKHDKLKKIIT